MKLIQVIFAIMIFQLFKSIFINLKEKDQQICFIIRSEFSKDFVNFSYVVHSNIYQGNKIQFELIDTETGLVKQMVQPDKNSFQRIFKFKNSDLKIYRACFTNPDENPKKIKFYVDNKKKIQYVEKNKLKASHRMSNELIDQTIKFEDTMFLYYMKLKDKTSELNNSRNQMQNWLLLKFLIILGISLAQFFAIAKVYKKYNFDLGIIQLIIK